MWVQLYIASSILSIGESPSCVGILEFPECSTTENEAAKLLIVVASKTELVDLTLAALDRLREYSYPIIYSLPKLCKDTDSKSPER